MKRVASVVSALLFVGLMSWARIAIVAALLAASAPLQAGNFNFLAGARQVDEDTWSPVDTHTYIGFELDVSPPKWPVSLTTGLHFSVQEKRDSTQSLEEAMNIVELSVGVKKLWAPLPRMRPYVGGGPSLILNAHFEIDPITLDMDTNDGGSFGFYLAGGILWRVGSGDARFNVGFDVRLLRGADASFAQRSGSLDYEQLAVLAGFNWGKDRDRR